MTDVQTWSAFSHNLWLAYLNTDTQNMMAKLQFTKVKKCKTQALNELLTAKDIPDYLNDIYLLKWKNG
jgi:hypothetical protein